MKHCMYRHYPIRHDVQGVAIAHSLKLSLLVTIIQLSMLKAPLSPPYHIP